MIDRDLDELLQIPQVKEFVQELILAQKKFYKYRFSLIKTLDEKHRLLLKDMILELGFPIQLKTEFGELLCFYKPQESYFRAVVGNIDTLSKAEANIPKSQHSSKSELLENASDITIAFYNYLLQNLKNEVEAAIKTSWKLSKIDTAKIIGRDKKLPPVVTEIINKVTKANRDRYTQKYGIGRGLGQKQKKSIWQDDFCRVFYQMVEGFPTVIIKERNKSIWEYAYFITDQLGKSHLAELEKDSRFSDAPPGLLRQAVKVWVESSENSRKVNPEFKPRNLLFVHALHKLGVNEKYKPSSLQTYWERGKRLYNKSDIKNQILTSDNITKLSSIKS